MTEAIAKDSEARVRDRYSNNALYPALVVVCSVSCIKKGFLNLIPNTIDRLRATIYQVATHLRVSAHDGLKCKHLLSVIPDRFLTAMYI